MKRHSPIPSQRKTPLDGTELVRGYERGANVTTECPICQTRRRTVRIERQVERAPWYAGEADVVYVVELTCGHEKRLFTREWHTEPAPWEVPHG